jgi:DNA-binding LacI/PurR family transcriptional regulator
MAKAVTLADIADRLGVSKSSVSLAINNRPGVGPELRASVLQLAQRMGYAGKVTHPQHPRRPNIVLLLHHPYEPQRGVTGVRYDYVQGAQAAAAALGFQVVVESVGASYTSALSLDILETRPEQVVGVLLVGMKGAIEPTIAFVRQLKVPTVVANRYLPDTDLSFVSIDHGRAEAMAVEYLVALGHRSIAFLGLERDAGYSWYEQRRKGYLAGMDLAGVQAAPRFLIEGTSPEAATEMLLRAAPDATAVCVISDEVAVSVLPELERRGKRVPADISVIGFDNDRRLPPTEPPLTTVGFDAHRIGYWAVRVLAEQRNDPQLSHVQLILTATLLARASCARPAE